MLTISCLIDKRRLNQQCYTSNYNKLIKILLGCVKVGTDSYVHLAEIVELIFAFQFYLVMCYCFKGMSWNFKY